jgi:ribokinase
MLRRRSTIADVANAAGVSIGTVSNYLNGTAKIKEITRERIEKAIDRLSYRPSVVARALSGQLSVWSRSIPGAPRLTVAGYISVDYLCRINALPQTGERITSRHIEKALGGPATNVAVAAAAVGEPYGLNVDLATAVGDDPDSDWALRELGRRGVHVLPVRRPANNRLSRAVVMIDAEGNRTIINEPFEISEGDLLDMMDFAPEPVPACLHIEGFHYERMAASIDRCHQVGWKVSLHSTGLPGTTRTPGAFLDLLKQIDLTFINDTMFREIFSLDAPISSMIEQARGILSTSKERGDVILTLGRHGAVVFPKSGGPSIEVPALPVDLVDATGAGDAFAGIFLSFWLNGASLHEAARHAAAGGSLAITAEGAQGRISTYAQLAAALAVELPEIAP